MGNFFSRLSEHQKKVFGWVALAAVFSLGLLILQPGSSSGPAPSLSNRPEIETPINTEELWQRELTAILDRLLGAKRARVFLTLERSSKLSVASSLTEEIRQDLDGREERRITSNPIILRDEGMRKEIPLVLEQEEPIVRGVLVVLDWDFDPSLRLRVAQAVQTVLQIPMHRIEVLFKE
ncbi:MAG: hypothetical protein GX335_05100 [Firmicutes bacterium]|nr:hypothetical protein [Bacillota bacterium]